MRLMARRILSGEWVSNDLPAYDVESTINLGGPGSISANLLPEANRMLFQSRRLIEDWATMIYVVDTSDDIVNYGIVLPPTEYDDLAKFSAVGVSGYPQGYPYDGAGKLYGPQAAVPAVKRKNGSIKTKGVPAIPQPDPVKVYLDYWAWILAQPMSNLDITFTGAKSSNTRVGSNAEPIRLRRYELQDMGQAMDDMAQQAPFEIVERARWSDDTRTTPIHEINLGLPRQGKRRNDLRFAQDENIAITPSITTLPGGNKLIGVGNGDPGPKMIYAERVWDDGRLRRTRVITDKTADTSAKIRSLMSLYEAAVRQPFDVTTIAVTDHPNARLSSINLGDDIPVQFDHPQYGYIDIYVRVLSITRGDSEHGAVLTTSNSALFNYAREGELT